jgi:hypothetical protein
MLGTDLTDTGCFGLGTNKNYSSIWPMLLETTNRWHREFYIAPYFSEQNIALVLIFHQG